MTMVYSRPARLIAVLLILVLAAVPGPAAAITPTPAATEAAAASLPAYTIAYTITVQEDGSARWQVEYRTPLATDAETALFGEYAAGIKTLYLPQFQDLIERSAAQATIANARPMSVGDFSGTADIQTSPTGRYGIVLYTFTWNGFAGTGSGLEIGDAFAGGMYLPRDTSLTIRYPDSYQVKSVDPAPDRTGSTMLTWYGQRTFGIARPEIILEKTGLPLVLILTVAGVLFLLAGGTFFLLRKRHRRPEGPRARAGEPADDADSTESPETAGVADPPANSLSASEMHTLGDQIVRLLHEAGGEMYQSDIVKRLGLPKSTVSSALNDLHGRGDIVKVKKGRENLIRLT